MPIDRFAKLQSTYEMPSNKLVDIVPDDGNDLPEVTRGIYIGGIGDLTVVDEYANQVTFVGLLPGIILPIRAVRVMATGTTATNLIGLL